MNTRITLEVDYNSLHKVILENLIDTFEYTDASIETMNALALVIKFYATEAEWKAFAKKNGL